MHHSSVVETLSEDRNDRAVTLHRNHEAPAKRFVPTLAKHAQCFESSAQQSTGLQLSTGNAQAKRPVRESDPER